MWSPCLPGGSRYPVTATLSPSLVWISVATPTSLPSLSFIDAPADSGSVSAGMLAHPENSITALASRSRLTIEPPVGKVRSLQLRHQPSCVVPEPLDAIELDLLVAPDLVGQLGDGHRNVVI